MMRTRPAAMLAERLAAIPTRRTSAGHYLVVRRLRWRVDFVSVLGFVVAMRLQIGFVGLGGLH
jgi:hypothetical protein